MVAPLASKHPTIPAFTIPSPHFSTDNKGKRKAEVEPEEQGLKCVKLDDGVHRILCLVHSRFSKCCLFFLTGLQDSRLPSEGWWPW